MTQAPEYWFARRFPLGSPRKAVAPVHWKGWALSGAYALVLMAGGLGFAWLGAGGRMIEGVAVFALAAAIGAGGYIAIAEAKSDKTRTVADYRRRETRV